MERYEPAPWPKRLIAGFIAAVVLLFPLTVTLPHSWIPQPAELWAAPFDRLAAWTSTLLLDLPPGDRNESDSPAMMAHGFNILIISGLLAPLLAFRPRVYGAIRRWLPSCCVYLLAWQLLHYGCNKLFKGQFYRPEPNIQYSRITDLAPDILYWTTMGTSRGYSIFLGSVEAFAAALLLLPRTRAAGGLLGCAILSQVLAVNFAFDITVKLLSGYLLLLSLVIVWAGRARLHPLLGWKPAPLPPPPRDRHPGQRWIRAALILAMGSDALLPYLRSGNFNDDAAARPALHGAYRVLPRSPWKSAWQRVFVHRSGYLILQDSTDRFRDYLLSTDTAEQVLWVSRDEDPMEHGLDYRRRGDTLLLWGRIGADSLALALVPLPLRY